MKEWRDYMVSTEPIGKGMYSKVYYGYHKQTKKEIALKKIYFNKLENKVKERIITEINILQKLNHKNIIKFHDYKFDGEYLLLITEYCNGGTLKDKLGLKIENLEIMIRQIIEGVLYLHTNNVIHRDIKPENILIHYNNYNDYKNEEDIDIKICDFGFSAIIKEQNELFNTMCGTPLYMSPEILFLKSYSKSSEIWSLGILFYNMIFNKHPFGILQSIDDYRSKIESNFLIDLNTKDIEYKGEIILKIIELLKNMLSYSSENRPTIEYISNYMNIENKISPHIGSLIYNINNKLNIDKNMTPFGSYNSPGLGPANSPSSPFIQNPYNSRKNSSDNDNNNYNDRIIELEEKVNKLEYIISSI